MNDLINIDLKTLKNSLGDSLEKFEWWALRSYYEKTQFRMARNGLNAQNGSETSQGVMVEVFHKGQIGYGATNDLSQLGLSRAVEMAKSMAETQELLPLTNFDLSVRPKGEGSYQSHFQVPLSELTPALVMDRLIKVTKNLKKDDAVIEASAWAMITDTAIQYLSANGSDWAQRFSMVTRDMAVTAKKGDVIQKRSLGMQGRQWGAESLDEATLLEHSERLLKEVHELLGAKECPSEAMDLILTPDQLYLQVHESIGHPLELDRILGDERNYAGWSFVGAEDFGKLRYGPEILNVTFDPGVDGELASYNFDDNGVPAQKEYLIEKGILKRGIGGIESQKRSSLEGVSCARSTSWNRAPIDRMGNINIEAGDSSFDEMIKSTENGILMQTNRSWSIDDYRNKFQFGCEYAHLIKDGEIKEVVKNPNYRSSTVQFWNSLSHVGNQETFEVWGSPYCGKGEPNQIIRVGHAIPTCKFQNIEVFGGA
jgi:predicted Zn-dependent protease